MLVGEYKFSEFEITKDDAVGMAVSDDLNDLLEQWHCFPFLQTSLDSHVRMQVAVGWREENESVVPTHDDLLDLVDTGVTIHANVTRQEFVVPFAENDLESNETALQNLSRLDESSPTQANSRQVDTVALQCASQPHSYSHTNLT